MSFIVNRFAKLTGFLHRHKFGTILTLSLVFVLVGSHFALADEASDAAAAAATATADSAAADAAAAATAAASAVSGGATTLTSFVNSFLPLALATILSIIAFVIGKMIVIVIGMVIIPILGYNGFATSGVVDIGWPLVRDVVNMFVVIVLLIIAVKTILGLGKANWEQQLPRLFLAIVAVNFSRTICLLLIDFGQVVMWTFVSAIRDIAAGNFVNLFQMNAFMGFGEGWLASQGNNGMNAFMFLAGAYATVVLLSMVLAVMLLMAVIFIYRIVILWVLIIMSPLAFFLGGISEVLGSAGGQYAQWWKKMIGAVTLGPILTFFLWLALAAASSGPIATSEGFANVASSDTGSTLATLPTEIFQMDKLLSLFIAIVLITVGFQAASTQAGALGGIAAQFVTEKGGMDLAKGLAAAPAALGYRGAKAAGSLAKTGGIELARQVNARNPELAQKLGGGLIAQASKLQGTGIVGDFAARRLAGLGGSIQKAGSEPEKEARKGATEVVGNMSEDEKKARVANRLKPDYKEPASQSARNEDNAMLADIIKSKSTQDEHKSDIKKKHQDAGLSGADLDTAVDKDMSDLMGSAVNAANKTKDFKDNYLGDDAGKAALLKQRTRALHTLPPDVQQDVVNDADFKARDISEAALKDPAVAELLKNKKSTRQVNGQDVETNILEAVARGEGAVSSKQRDIAKGHLPPPDPFSDKASAKDVSQGLNSGTLDISSITVDHITANKQVVQGMINSNADLSKVSSAAKPAVEQALNRERAKDPTKQADIDRKMFQLTGNLSAAHGYDDSGQSIPEGEIGHRSGGNRSLVVNIKNDMTYLAKMPDSATSPGTDMAKGIVAGVKAEDIQRAAELGATGSQEEKNQMSKAIKKMQKMQKMIMDEITNMPTVDPFSAGAEEARAKKEELQAKHTQSTTSLKSLQRAGAEDI